MSPLKTKRPSDVASRKREASWRRQGMVFTVRRYSAMFKRQGGVCALCGKPPHGRRLDVDHDHKTKVIRGLLCRHCNRNLRVCRWLTHQWLDRARRYCGLPERTS